MELMRAGILHAHCKDGSAGVITFEMTNSGATELEAVAKAIAGMKGMGREGMSRRHAFYKMVSLVQGVNILKKERGMPVTPSLAADPAFSLLRTT